MIDLVLLGEVVGASTVDIRKLAPPTVGAAVALLEQLYGIEQQAISKGASLPGPTTRTNNLTFIGDIAAKLRQLPRESKLSAADWEAVRGASMKALGDYAAVSDGQAYQSVIYDKVLDDLAESAKQVAATIAAAPGNFIASALGIPPWTLYVGGGVLLLGVGYVGYRYVKRNYL